MSSTPAPARPTFRPRSPVRRTSTPPTPRRPPRSSPGARPRRASAPTCCSRSPTRSRRGPTSSNEAECRNTGKPRARMAEDETPIAADHFRFFAGRRAHAGGPDVGRVPRRPHLRRSGTSRSASCGQVTPWNYPMMMAVWKIAPAIAAGNTVVLKPSDTTPVSTLKLAEILGEVLPPGVFNVVGGDRETGALVVGHPTAQMVAITGSVGAGMAVAKTAADDLKRVHLELGGKAPVVVFDDVKDLKAAADGHRHARVSTTPARTAPRPAACWSTRACTTSSSPRSPRPAASTVTGDLSNEDALYGPLNNANQLARVAGLPRPGPGARQGPDRRPPGRRQGLLLRADRRRRPPAGRRDGAGRDLRPGHHRPDVLRRGRRAWPRPTASGTACRSSVWTSDHGRAMRMSQAARLRRRVGQHPHPVRLGDAARRLQALRLRQGPVGVRICRTTPASSTSCTTSANSREQRDKPGMTEIQAGTEAADAASGSPKCPPSSSTGVVKEYLSHGEAVQAVKGVDLAIAEGEFFSLLGPSGLRQDHDHADDRRVRGADARHGLAARPGRHRRPAEQARREHGLPVLRAVPAHERLGERRLRPQAQEGRRRPRSGGGSARCWRSSTSPAGRSAARARCPAASSSGSRWPARWSTGPRALLLDEPLGALDLKLRQAMQVELKRIQREVGITFVYVTHDQGEALTMSRPHRRHERRPDRAARHAAGDLRAARRPSSWPGSSAPPTCSSGTVDRVDGGHRRAHARRRRSGSLVPATARRAGDPIERHGPAGEDQISDRASRTGDVQRRPRHRHRGRLPRHSTTTTPSASADGAEVVVFQQNALDSDEHGRARRPRLAVVAAAALVRDRKLSRHEPTPHRTPPFCAA